MAHARDCVTLELPNALRDRIASHRLHPRMAMHEIIEEALSFWEESGGWAPFVRAPVDGYGDEVVLIGGLAGRHGAPVLSASA